jgi:GNAT superfamily N-acetyltransferase
VPEIRAAEPSDLPQIMSFDALVGDRLTEIMDKRMLVADDGQIQAYLSWQHGGCLGKDYVGKLVVRPERQRRGLARKLLDALADKRSGRMFISTGERNIAALGLISATGWTFAGRVAGLLSDDEAEFFIYRDHGEAARLDAASKVHSKAFR